MRGRLPLAFLVGLGVGIFGGLLGLGGAELRLPFLLYAFGLAPLEAVIANKALSLLVVGVSLPARLGVVPPEAVLGEVRGALALLLGSVLGAFGAAGWARRVPEGLLRRTMGLLLLLLAGVLALEALFHRPFPLDPPPLLLHPLGFLLGLGIGAVAAVMGVAGGELLIPTLVLLYGLEARLAGSVSLLISLPTMLAAFAQYSQDRTFAVLWRQGGLLLAMGLGSLLGAFLGGGLLLGLATERVLLLLLALLLALSGLRLLRH
ncbi:TSUP family transporter [Thermus thermamylovorans]|uniref:Probable membrane transporter protein n=1 Tax=Thermus thermamylovorans TaxID=2509362 RepID=A0A4Q9B5H7_9DEIN|nr:TSUP family transporter [Thermus thermamylovorans]TBH20853.1 sulfite exporter TauE/SafE family protein [Thermus thermamylovorans]